MSLSLRNQAWLATLLPLAVSAGIIAILYTNHLDTRITGLFYDLESCSWPWRGHWLTAGVFHDRGRDLIALIGVSSLLIAILGNSNARTRPMRRSAMFVALAIGLSSGIAGLLKHISPDPCPWFAVDFGGDFIHGTFFNSSSPTGAMGHGSPGAHATGGFALMCFYYPWRTRNPARAWTFLLLGWVIGSAYGIVQVVRGAHYPSHNYWACILAWSVCTLLYWGPFRGRLGAAERPQP